MKKYIDLETNERGTSAAVAMAWHRAGHEVLVKHDDGRAVSIRGKHQPRRLDENARQCKSIAKSVNAWAAGDVRKCPECGETIQRDEWPDIFKCPECGHIDEADNYEMQTIWDYLSDIYNVEFRVDNSKELRSVQIMVACGGPNIYLDTASKDVELYWWTESARWPLSYEAVQALDDWAEEYWGCL